MATGTAWRPSSKSTFKNVALSERSRCMECAVCLEVVFDKDNRRERVFGLLPNCKHCFCLSCIRTWRTTNPFSKTSRTCPVCRVESRCYVHSDYWLEDQDKVKLIQKYKDDAATKPCRYYAEGRKHCLAGSDCLYKHEPRVCFSPKPDLRLIMTFGHGTIQFLNLPRV